jgi:hypothetical protein
VGLSAIIALAAPGQMTWKLDRIDHIGGHAVRVEGAPTVIDTPAGEAIEFHGGKDALFLDVHPLEGAETFTWEVIFRPDSDGPVEQRFFHFQVPGEETRMLFELRIRDGKWFLDTYANSRGTGQTLANTGHLHSLAEWHHAAQVYDGREYRNYVDGELEGKAEVKLAPQGPGQCSIGTRINRRDYFKGAILLTRMTRRALGPDEFLKVPKALAGRGNF